MKSKLKQTIALLLTCVLVVSVFGTSLSAFSADINDFDPGLADNVHYAYSTDDRIYGNLWRDNLYNSNGEKTNIYCPQCGEPLRGIQTMYHIYSYNDYGLLTAEPGWEDATKGHYTCPDCGYVNWSVSTGGTNKIIEIQYKAINLVHSDGTITLGDEIYYDCYLEFESYGGETVYLYPAGNTSWDTGIAVGGEDSDHIYGDPTFDWDEYDSCTAVFECTICGYIESVDCDITSEVTVEPTETTDGERTYTATCEFDGVVYTATRTETIPATGEPTHEHDYDEPTFDWANDYSSCTAIFECVDGDDTQTVECEVTSSTDPADCENDGSTTYYAECEFEGETYTDTQVVIIPALGHTYGEPEFDWSEFNLETGEGAVTATFTCTCGHEETVACEVESNEDGDDIVYTATAEFEGETYTDTMTYEGEEPVAEEPDDTDEPESSTEATVPTGGSSSTGTTGGTSGNTGSTSGTVSPQTSDIISIAAVVALALASGSVGVLTLYRRKRIGNAQ